MKKTILIILFCAWMAQADYGIGSGSGDNESSAILIDSIEAWATLATTSTDWDKYIKVSNNIDFEGMELDLVGLSGNKFSGIFDGDGHVFFNGRVKSDPDRYNSVALFRRIASTAIIKDLTLENFSVVGSSPNPTQSYCSLLVGETTYGSLIDNCHIINPSVTVVYNQNNHAYVGVVVGANHGYLTNCTVVGGSIKADITSGKALMLGGVVGLQTGGIGIDEASKTENCTSSVLVSSLNHDSVIKAYVGGIVGCVSTTAGNTNSIFSCSFSGSINFTSLTKAYIGGIGGYASGEILQSANTGDIFANLANTDGATVGGVFGYTNTFAKIESSYAICDIVVVSDVNISCGGIGGNTANIVTGCHFSGAITVSSDTSVQAGGIVGYCRAGITIDKCYALVDLSINKGTSTHSGGAFGQAATGTISNCYVAGTICDASSGSTASIFDLWGGFLGYANRTIIERCYTAIDSWFGVIANREGFIALNRDCTIVDCFWDTEISGVIESDGGQGKTTEQMQTIDTFVYADWNFYGENNVWLMFDNSYPILAWQAFSGGDGTVENPYQVSTGETLELVNNDLDASYILINDIELSDETYNQSLIAPDLSDESGFQGTSFIGLFDGNGFEIRNLTISGGVNDFVGFFGCIGEGGEVKDLALIDCDITGNYDIGALAGLNYYGSISNSCSTGVITGLGNVGGLVGENIGVLSACYSTATVTAVWYAGGLVGYNYGGSISNGYCTGDVTGNGIVGGFVGYNSYGQISNSYSTSAVSGSGDIGGFVGFNYEGSIQKCFWNVDTSGLAISDGGDKKTMAQMQRLSTFVDAAWDFVGEGDNGDMDVWYMFEEDYPRLYWEAQTGDINYDGFVDEFDLDAIISQWLGEALEDQRLTADIDGSGRVDNVDLAMLANVLRPPSVDINNDGVIDGLDLRILCDNWLVEEYNIATDLNEDGVVDILDYSIFALQW